MSLLSKLFTDLDNAVDELIHYTKPILPTNFQQPAEARDQDDDELVRRIVWGLPTAGSLTSQQSVDALKEAGLANDTNENPALIIVGGSGDCMYNKIEAWSKLENPSVSSLSDVVRQQLPEGDGGGGQARLALFFVNSHLFGPSARGGNVLNLFFNGIPTLQWSLCQPYLDIQVTSPGNTVGPGASASGARPMSLLRFLNGAAGIEEDAPEFINLLAAITTEERNEAEDVIDIAQGSAGMELFTTPQIMGPAMTSYNPELNASPIIDRFRPLLSVKDFSVTVTGKFGVGQFENATLSLVLHDRSRMTELVEFLSMGHWGKTLLTIEWGWSHPHGKGVGAGSDNAYGRFINGLRRSGVYQVNKYSMSTDPVGQMIIKIDFHIMASESMKKAKITDGMISGTADRQRRLDRLMSIIKQATGILRGTGGLKSKRRSMRSAKTLGQISTFQSLPNLDTFKVNGKTLRELFDDVQTALDDASIFHDSEAAADAASDLTSALSEAMDPSDSSDDEDVVTKNEALQEVDRKIGICSGIVFPTQKMRAENSLYGNATPDPFAFLTAWIATKGIDSTDKPLEDWLSKPTKNFVTFAKLMAIFIGSPLIEEPDYSDVQLIFHKFNNQAGLCGVRHAGEEGEIPSINIGEFIIEIAKFKRAITAWFSKRTTFQMNLKEFVTFIIDNFIHDQTNIMYGVSDFWYVKSIDQDGTRNVERRNYLTRRRGRATDDRLSAVLNEAGASSTFKMPRVETVIEVKAQLSPPDDQVSRNKILKVHFIDKAASLYAPIADTLTSAYNGFIDPVSAIPMPEETPVSYETMEEYYKLRNPDTGGEATGAYGLGGEEIINPLNSIDATKALTAMPTNINLAALYSAIRTMMPSVEFGCEGTAVQQLNITSDTGGDGFTEIAMERGGPAPGPLTPTGLDGSGIPLRVFPGKVSVTSIGCPPLEFMQDIFIYMGTGTTYDNIYRINKITHKLSPGKFESTFTAGFQDQYGQFQTFSTTLKTIADRAQTVLDEQNE